VKHCPKCFERRREEETREKREKEKRKLTFSIGNWWRVLEVKVMHHLQEHWIVVLMHAVAPLDITT